MDLCENKKAVYRHPWELSRTDIILKNLYDLNESTLKLYHGRVLDIGCGDSYFDEKLIEQFDVEELYGIDINLEQPFDNGKSHYVNSYNALEGKKFDVILLMDVIEHVKDDNSFMNEIQKYLDNDGIILITVPAFQCLFSTHDKELHHYRRYNFKQLNKVLKKNNIKVKDWNYFYLSLLIVRYFTKDKSIEVNSWKYNEKDIRTRITRFILNLDYTILKVLSLIHIHIGGLSLMVICQKSKKS